MAAVVSSIHLALTIGCSVLGVFFYVCVCIIDYQDSNSLEERIPSSFNSSLTIDDNAYTHLPINFCWLNY